VQEFQPESRRDFDFPILVEVQRFVLVRMGARPPGNLVPLYRERLGKHPGSHLSGISLQGKIFTVLEQPDIHLGCE
jgi:hypothetical protein